MKFLNSYRDKNHSILFLINVIEAYNVKISFFLQYFLDEKINL